MANSHRRRKFVTTQTPSVTYDYYVHAPVLRPPLIRVVASNRKVVRISRDCEALRRDAVAGFEELQHRYAARGGKIPITAEPLVVDRHRICVSF